MSKYQVTQTVFSNPEFLCAALKDVSGFTPEVHENPVNLTGYAGDRRKEVAHIVVPRKQTGLASNDLGFLRVDGKYTAILSDYDRAIGYNETWLGKLSQRYKELQTLSVAKTKGYKFLGREIVQTATGQKVQLRFSA